MQQRIELFQYLQTTCQADVQSITTTSAALQFASKARALKTKVQPSVFKTPFKVPPVQSQFKTPGKTPFKTPGSLPYRTPLAPIQRNKAASPMGASFAVPEKISMLEKYEDLDESVLLAGSFDRRNLPKLSETDDIENRIQMAVMERVDIFLEGFKDKLAQSLLANCSGAHLSCQSLLDGNSANTSSHARRSELDALNLTSALGENKTLTSQSIGSRRRSVRLAEKRNAQ
ncbi:hypothetical protein DAPPUDRAFT_259772 [Daphnia pulex]|uniref:Uncharacterized protein n=1 Tax=Daphnia pulex TaxID=6669 RepID=E9HHU5_DAPPU|nr:hypothetical protein DAPPUDRAFT_259772 [Daphnia pulex]|eukprot:EFX68706.1 hypothetical protein DAPPUDRAFT_259772 [Daphnia pulex]